MRFVYQARNAFILGPVGVGKTFLATALGHIACRRRIGVQFERADKLHKRLKAARLDASSRRRSRAGVVPKGRTLATDPAVPFDEWWYA